MSAPLPAATLAAMDEANPGWRNWTAQRRLDLARRYEAGSAGETEAQKRERILIHKHGSIAAAPASEQAQLSDLKGERRTGPPKPRPPVSVTDLGKNAASEVAELERRATEHLKPHPGDTVRMMVWRTQESQRLQERANGLRRAFGAVS